MSLDPSAKKVLDLLKNIELSNLTVEQARNLMNMGIERQIREDVRSTEDFSIQYNGIEIPCRLYEPFTPTDALIVYYHGGGFMFGSIELFDHICRKAANSSGCKVVSVEYRLAPEHKFPAAVDDAYYTYIWINNNAKKFGVNVAKVALAGDSAGANLATVTCLRCKDTNVALPALQVLFYPVVAPDVCSSSVRQFGDGFFLTKASMKWFTQLYLSSAQDLINPYMFPIFHQHPEGLPEAIIITAEHDPLRDQGEMYNLFLREAGVQSTCIQAKGMIHGFLNFSYLMPPAVTIADMVFSIVGKKLNAK
ncbi:MAG: alpha/beta hydrolase [Spirochaetes bacterium]|nr:alpha/beta hydrolase [Spirochaetota bacterium]